MLLEGLGDETNAKLLLQAEYMIFYRAFSEKEHASCKIAKSCILAQKCDF